MINVPEIEPNVSTPVDERKAAHQVNTVRFGLATGILMLAVSTFSAIATILSGIYSFPGIILTVIVAIVGFVSARLAQRGRHYLGAGILTASILLVSLFLPFISKGQGIQLAILTIVIVSAIGSGTLPSTWAWRAAAASMVIGLLVTLSDLFLPDFGFPSDPLYTTAFAFILSIVYGIYILRQFPTYSLGTKLSITFIVIVLIPVVALGFQATTITRQNLLNDAFNDLAETAQVTARYIDRTLRSEILTVATEAQTPDLIEYLGFVPGRRAGSPEERRVLALLQSFQQKDANNIISYALLDPNGFVILDSDASNIGNSEADTDYFRETLASTRTILSPVRISRVTREAYFHISAPVVNPRNETVGILRARIRAGFLQTLLQESTESPHEEHYAVLVDNETYIRIAHTGDENLLFKSYETFRSEQVAVLQQDERLLPGIDYLDPQPDVITGIRNLASQPIFTAPADITDRANTYSSGYPISNANWTVLIRRTERSILEPIQTQTQAFTVLALVLIALGGLAGSLVSQIISRPLVDLSKAASEISAGNLTTRVRVTTRDEIGTLGSTFNAMAGQLYETLTGLESRVEERTAELSNASQRAEIRAQELETISQLTRAIAAEQNIDSLLPLTARLVSERFSYYHTGIFLVDEDRQFAVLQAANSEGGQRMLARGHRLQVGPSGIVGYVAQTGQPRIALDVGEDAIFFNNPDLPETRSEMALPLTLRGQVIGVLDVQSTEQNAFNEDSISTLTILADQITIAIENARLFSATQRALQDVQALYAQYLKQEWLSVAERKQAQGYLQGLTGGQAIFTLATDQPIEQALTTGQMIVSNTDSREETVPTLAIPIALRGQVIGVLRAKAGSKDRAWTPNEIRIAQAVSDRVALALENARLFEESQRRASKERIIGEISSKISAAANVDNILQTAVEELGRTLQGSQVAIQLEVNHEINEESGQ